MPQLAWLPEPPAGTSICLGFDGSLNNDWTALQAETMDGFSFTPRWGPNQFGTYWNPAEHGDRIPHGEVETAVDELFDRFDVVRAYCDPHDWETDIEDWARKHGDDHVITWETNRIKAMWAEITRFENDLREGRITHDGDPVATLHIGQAKKVGKPGQMYILGKPNEAQKIDLAMARILAHTAVRDSLAGGWEPPKPRSKMRVFRG
ncbi:MAG: terminase [Pseudolysinimonas sp.]